MRLKCLSDTVESTMINIHRLFGDLDYRVTGLTAVNFYGYAISTNVFDIAVGSDRDVRLAVKRLGLPSSFVANWDPYVARDDRGFYIKLQGDILGEPYVLDKGIKLQEKELLLKRLSIYAKQDACILKACAFIALTLDPEKTEKYKNEWNRL